MGAPSYGAARFHLPKIFLPARQEGQEGQEGASAQAARFSVGGAVPPMPVVLTGGSGGKALRATAACFRFAEPPGRLSAMRWLYRAD